MQITLKNLTDTNNLARKIARQVKAGQVWAFFGDLGTGKTTLIQMIAKELGVKEIVTSPTFVIEKRYKTHEGLQIIHIDCYRFQSSNDAQSIGHSEFDNNKIYFIEWAEKITNLLPNEAIKVFLTHNRNVREIKIEGINL